ncbi:MAG: hypothetical protein GY714_18075 [Desulfobacterales bacterium]|nr:hypothetical protein [Desulfobacterales bacterium]
MLKKMNLTNSPNGIQSFFVSNNAVEKTAAYTVVITTDSGKTFASKTDGVVFTLPAIAIGNTVTFVNTAEDGLNTLTVSPNASDGITYAGSSTDDKDIINTKATSKKGDYVTLASLDGTTAWQVVDVRGIWAKE